MQPQSVETEHHTRCSSRSEQHGHSLCACQSHALSAAVSLVSRPRTDPPPEASTWARAMPPQARARAGARARGRGGGRIQGPPLRDAAAVSNARKAQRKAAVHELNVMAAEVGLKTVSVKRLRAVDVEQLARALQRRMRSAVEAARLRRTLEAWVANGGSLSVPVLDAEDPDALPESPLDGHRVLARGFRLESKDFMLTYNSGAFTREVWPGFEAFTSELAGRLGSRAWSACLEQSEAPGRFHLHSYFFWTDGLGVKFRNLDAFVFEGVTPRADVCRAGAQDRLNRPGALRGLYYVSIMKRGTIASSTNFHVWKDYVPKAQWLTAWWNQHKLTHEQYLEHSVQFRTGHRARKAEVDSVVDEERRLGRKRRREEALGLLSARRRGFKPRTLQVRRWLASFNVPNWRYSMLVLVGPSKMGKSELAKDMRGPEKTLLVDCQNALHPDLADFDPERHEAVVFDEISGADFVIRNKKLLQGHVDGARLGQSPTQRFAYEVMLWRVPIVLTCNHWDPTADGLRPADQDWLLENCVVEAVNAPVWQ